MPNNIIKSVETLEEEEVCVDPDADADAALLVQE